MKNNGTDLNTYITCLFGLSCWYQIAEVLHAVHTQTFLPFTEWK
jgi:hypothetical protein